MMRGVPWLHCYTLLLLLHLARMLPIAAPSPTFLKLGAWDVHDEQSVAERLRVMAVMQQLQQARLQHPQGSGEASRERTEDGGASSREDHVTSQPWTEHAHHTTHTEDGTQTEDGSSNQNRVGGRDSSVSRRPGPRDSDGSGASRVGGRTGDRVKCQNDSSVNVTTVSSLDCEGDNSVERSALSTAGRTTDSEGGMEDGTRGVDSSSLDVANSSLGVANSSMGVVDSSVDVVNGSVGVTDSSVGVVNSNVDVANSSADMANGNQDGTDSFVGVANSSMGVDRAGLLYEGDIMLLPEEAEELLGKGGGGGRRRRKVAYSTDKRWTLPIPYMFDTIPQYRLNDSEQERVRAVISHLQDLTCITLQEVNATHDTRPILSFKKDAGCWSYVGKERAFHFQEVSTGEGCFEFGTLLHELGHAIGFWHEHSRPDRNAFIHVHRESVRPGEEYNFDEESWGKLDNMDVPYDVSSIMHYGSTYFSKNGEVTIQALDTRLQRVVGQRLEMSFYDVKLANKAYCSDVCKGSPVEGACLHEGYPDPKNCNRCRCPPGLAGSRCQQVAPYQGPVVCGGPLWVEQGQRYSISSPQHAFNVYPANVACHWLIQTREGLQVKLTVSGEDFMTHAECTGSPTDICTDYLEVKYNVSFGFTGARYCCGLPPSSPLVSGSNAMLVIFRTRQAGRGGFKADIEAEPCGGCHPGPESQPPCRKSVRTQCVKKWNTTEYVSCSPFFRGTSSNCDKWVTKTESRLGICSQEVDYCCDGYRLQDGLCRASNNSSTLPPTVQPLSPPVGEYNATSSTNNSTDINQDPDTGWSSWLPWQPCSRSCGGCGVQTRTRVCDNPMSCGGRSHEQESRACNTFPCPELLVYMCAKSVVKDYYCGWGTKCYRRVTEYAHCYTSCCPSHVELAGKCVPKRR